MPMTTDQIFGNLFELNQLAAEELTRTYFNESDKRTSLVFSKTRNGVVRVSEQELRFALTSLFDTNKNAELTYTVETPTENDYSFSGAGRRSGSSDLSFYKNNIKVLNIEFKGHNSIQKSIDKDIEKLVNENCHGAWCHIFKNEDSGTLASVFNKLKIALKKHGVPKKPLYFSFLILEKRKLITRKGMDTDLPDFDPDQIFNLQYSDHYNLPVINPNTGYWQINYF